MEAEAVDIYVVVGVEFVSNAPVVHHENVLILPDENKARLNFDNIRNTVAYKKDLLAAAISQFKFLGIKIPSLDYRATIKLPLLPENVSIYKLFAF